MKHIEIQEILLSDSRYANKTIERLLSKVDKTEGCWNWQGAQDGHGYGQLSVGGRKGQPVKARVVSHILHGGRLTDTHYFVCHHCDNRLCVNPAHLYTGDARSNYNDMVARERINTSQVSRNALESNPQAKLTIAIAEQIRAEYVPRKVTQQYLADKYAIARTTVQQIIENRTWMRN